MKTIFCTAFLLVAAVATLVAQKIEFSSYLAPVGGVHSSTPSVTDRNGNIFVAGGTREGLRVTNDAFQKKYQGHTDKDVTGGDAFLMKLSPTGELIYSTYIGGSGSENYCLKLAIDDFGNVYVGFTTDSQDLPVSKNACQKSIKGDNDHYIIKFSNDCRYIASTYLGGSGSDHWTTLAVHNNSLYLFGKTMSNDFPVTERAIQKKYDNSAPPDTSQSWMAGDITITALSLNLDKTLFSTYLGGKSLDYIRFYSFDSDGKIILTGATYSDNFPTTKNAYQKSMSGKPDGFLTILSQNLSEIDYSTFIGGDSTDQVNAVFVEDANNIILTGETKSPDFPVTSDALNKKYMGGRSDGFIMKFNLKSNKPVYSSFIGGSKTDWLKYVARTDQQKYVVVGTSGSKDFPVTKDALYPSINGGMDLVILIFDKTLKNIEYSTYGGGSKQRVMDPVVSYVKGGKLLISSLCISPDFPATIKYAEPDSTWTNCLWKFDLNRK
ncbi:MAG: SBBP repeat-containing protein [Bacteroidales bacterium]|nr:SBBP repeat-containing protein [Bacteroidales bacterium]